MHAYSTSHFHRYEVSNKEIFNGPRRTTLAYTALIY